MTAEEAERRARACAERLGRWFKSIPSAEDGEVDPLVQQANACAGGETLSDIKADAGGKVGIPRRRHCSSLSPAPAWMKSKRPA